MRSWPLSTPWDPHLSLHHEILTSLYTMRFSPLSTPWVNLPSLYHEILTSLYRMNPATLYTPWDPHISLHPQFLTSLYTLARPWTLYNFQVQPGHQTPVVDLDRAAHGMPLEPFPKCSVDATNTHTGEDSWIRHWTLPGPFRSGICMNVILRVYTW